MVEIAQEKLSELVNHTDEDGVDSYSIAHLWQVITLARKDLHKYCLVRDISGSKTSGAASFFSYRGRLFELHKALIRVRAIENLTFEEMTDMLRREIVIAMRAGEILCIDCGKLATDFKTELGFLPWDLIFNFEKFREQDCHTTIVK